MPVSISTLRRLALALPEAVELPHHDMRSWRAPGAKGRIFATLTPDGAMLHCFVGGAELDRALVLYAPVAEPLSWANRPAGVRLRLAEATLPMVRELLAQAYAHKVRALTRPATSRPR